MSGHQNLDCDNGKKESSAVDNESLEDQPSSSTNLPETQENPRAGSSAVDNEPLEDQPSSSTNLPETQENPRAGSSTVDNEPLENQSSSSINLPGTQKKPKKKDSSQPQTRTKFTYRQLNILESEFNRYPYLSMNPERRQELCDRLGLPEGIIRIWFANRRVIDKNLPVNWLIIYLEGQGRQHLRYESGLLPLPSPPTTTSSSPWQESMIPSDMTFNNHYRYSPCRYPSPSDFGNNPLHDSHHQPSSSSSMNLPPLQWPGVNSPTSSISSSHSNTSSQYQSELSSNSDYSHVNNSYYQQNIDTTIMLPVATQASSNRQNSVNLGSTHNVAASNVNNNQQFIPTDVSPLPNTSTTYSSTTTYQSNTFSPNQSELSGNFDYYSPVNNFNHSRNYTQNIDTTIIPSIATPVVPSQATPTSSISSPTTHHSDTISLYQFDLLSGSNNYSRVNNFYYPQNFTQNIDTTIMPPVATQASSNRQNSVNLRSTHNVAASNVNNNEQFISTDVSSSPNTPTTTTYSFQPHK